MSPTAASTTSQRAASPAAMRLLADLPPRGSAASLADHRAHHPRPVESTRPLTALIEAAEQSGLQGRGGAGFPIARKMRAVLGERGRSIVVANGTEGEPASYKDKFLLSTHPHLVIDGALWAAAAVGADQVIIAVERTSSQPVAALRRALGERASAERAGVAVTLAETPPGYVSGEASALVQFLNGGAAKPTTTPPRMSERGVGRQPTLVNNIETLAHLALVAQHGPAWFRSAGTHDNPGTALVTVTGAVERPGVTEVAYGTTLQALIERAGPVGRPAAALIGGFYGAWIPATQFGLPFSRSGLAAAGASPGAGVIVVLPESACGLTETARMLAWFARESAAQCGPCRFGLPAMAQEMAAVCRGPVPSHGISRLQRWGGDIEGRGACGHPDGAVLLLRSALRVFAADLDRHLRGQPCSGSLGQPVIPVPGVGTLGDAAPRGFGGGGFGGGYGGRR